TSSRPNHYSSSSETAKKRLPERVITPPTPSIFKELLGVQDTEILLGIEDHEFVLEEEITSAEKENKRNNEMYGKYEKENGKENKGSRKEREKIIINENGDNGINICQDKITNEAEKRRVRDEGLEVKMDLNKKTDSTVLKQPRNKKEVNSTDGKSVGNKIQSRLKELKQMQYSKVMLNVGGGVNGN
ncbi:hypothetical protein CHS0354_016968, partial [Potamilus streckersoni]